MAAVIVARRRHRLNKRLRRERIFPTRVNIFGMNEPEIIDTYRLSSNAILELLDELWSDLEPATKRSHAIPSMAKLLAVLHFLASGSFQRTVAVHAGLSQSSFSSALSQVLNAMSRRMNSHIQFPHTPAALKDTKSGFYALADFPNVIGAIDCTHVKLAPPSPIDYVCRNHRSSHMLSVQVVCDSEGIITNVVAKASVKDNLILQNSALFTKLKDGDYGEGWLLGDSAYPLQPFLLTPVLNPCTPGEHCYNAAHSRTRSIVEHTCGVLKSRFRCLDRNKGGPVYSPQKLAQIVVVCCMLHNIAERHGLEHEATVVEEEHQHLPHVGLLNSAGLQARASVIQESFP
ncbi:putative nuclease HARBI1 [Gouania willdenowi]|uniref:Putative nuclease HARBI1 n=1 Tax=Gouania willdenowi TaxID=441366 RepID=A0A8C5E936_GOUWI|nr:putative nuclease HARBI1 [Gouania willdenowi]